MPCNIQPYTVIEQGQAREILKCETHDWASDPSHDNFLNNLCPIGRIEALEAAAAPAKSKS